MIHTDLITHLEIPANFVRLRPRIAPRRAILYTRCSTPQQNSFQDQERRCRAFADIHSIDIIGEAYRETASARGRFLLCRPVLCEVLLRAIEYDAVILVDEISRLSRCRKDAELLYDTGIPFLVRDRDLLRPLGRDFLRTRIARAARNSNHKSAAQIDANIRRDKKARPRNNLGDAERLKGRLKNQTRRADDIRRAAECLAHQPDIARMDHAQKVGYLSSRGVRREFVKGAREWDLQSFKRAWKRQIEPLMRDYIILNGWFVDGYSPA
ncbi:recombinase family protein [Ponticoccus sp. (in: a-proteobacteria)]|uniref:recombinase family protein n=1 Tax=Ponticoccus sp. (in: a-proteobacteria) TaxID=1925025 RepID=UPI003AB6C000